MISLTTSSTSRMNMVRWLRSWSPSRLLSRRSKDFIILSCTARAILWCKSSSISVVGIWVVSGAQLRLWAPLRLLAPLWSNYKDMPWLYYTYTTDRQYLIYLWSWASDTAAPLRVWSVEPPRHSWVAIYLPPSLRAEKVPSGPPYLERAGAPRPSGSVLDKAISLRVITQNAESTVWPSIWHRFILCTTFSRYWFDYRRNLNQPWKKYQDLPFFWNGSAEFKPLNDILFACGLLCVIIIRI